MSLKPIPSLFLLLLVTGCSGSTPLMPTPNLYAHGNVDPFEDVSPGLRTNSVDVLYLTDRERTDNPPTDNASYGYSRSRSVAFGLSRVEFGEHVSWDQLVAASRASKRSVNLPMHIVRTTEVGRFPPTPKSLVEPPSRAQPATQAATNPSTLQAQRDDAAAKADALLSEYLARTANKDVYLFVHGFNNTFYDSVTTIAELWHFFGRQGVPVAYTWPAGHGGLLTAYNYDRESSEFTVYHLKQMIRRIAANPDVHKIHIIAHSRGTDVALSALRELNIEFTAAGRSTRDTLKLGTLVLAAPDLDFEVIVQRAFTAHLEYIPERTILYVHSGDDALGLSTWLFGSLMRLGKLRSDVFTPQELDMMREQTSFEIVDVRVSDAGVFDHDYFHSSPSVSSDLVLVMRYHDPPGAAYGRPLKVEDHEFWMIDDKYPTPATQPTTNPQARTPLTGPDLAAKKR